MNQDIVWELFKTYGDASGLIVIAIAALGIWVLLYELIEILRGD